MERVYTLSDIVSSRTTAVYTRLMYVVCTLLAMSYISTSQAELLHHENYKTINRQRNYLDLEYKYESNRIDNSTNRKYKSNYCLTPICQKAAQNMIKYRNKKIDPCDNFYEYACGNWAKYQKVPNDTKSYKLNNILTNVVRKRRADLINGKTTSNVKAKSVKKVLNLYNTCMNEFITDVYGPGNLETRIKQLGGYPLIKYNWDPYAVGVLDLSIKLRIMNIDTLFYQFVQPDREEPSVHRLHIDQVFMNLGSKRNYRDKSILKRYEDFIVEIAVVLGGDRYDVRKDAKDIISFEKTLSEARSGTIHNIRSRTYNKYTLLSFKIFATDSIPWDDYFNKQLQRMGMPLVNDSTIIISYAPDNYFKVLMRLLETTPKRTIVNYQIFTMIYNMVGYMGQNFRYAIETFFNHPIKKEPRHKVCEDVVMKFMKWTVKRMYAEKYVDRSSINEVVSKLKTVKGILRHHFKYPVWMDNSTNKYAIEKLSAINEHIGYPDFIMDDAKLDSLYEHSIVGDRYYIENIFQSWMNIYYTNLKKMDTGHTDELWNADDGIIDNYYDEHYNLIGLSAGSLQNPLYNKDYPKYLNYAGIGSVYGHMLTHAFDYRGGKFDKKGLRKDWWSPYVVEQFENLSKCYVEQYNKFFIPEINRFMDGRKALIENIADNGGLELSYFAYRYYIYSTRKGEEEHLLPGVQLTINQLFFLQKAQVHCSEIYDKNSWELYLNSQHCPDRYRVLGMMANSHAFSLAYNCPVGRKMNPHNKCKIW